jgi:Predicted membrane protein (DUF2306)
MRLPILVFHISAGVLALLSGAVAIAFRKGSRGHRVAGNVFVLSMLGMAAAAAYLAFLKHEMGNFLGGVFTLYLVTTAWLTAKRGDGETSIFDWGFLLLPLAIGATNVICGLEAAQSQTGLKDGYSAGLYFFSASLALLAAAGDVRVLVRGGVSGMRRLTRHLWRMCYALFVATGAFFLGQQQVFPAFLRKTNVLLVPAFLPLLLMIFWLFRVRLTNAYNGKSMPRGSDVYSLPT